MTPGPSRREEPRTIDLLYPRPGPRPDIAADVDAAVRERLAPVDVPDGSTSA